METQSQFTDVQIACKQRRRVVRFAFCSFCGCLIREGDLLHEHDGKRAPVEDWHELDRDVGELTRSATPESEKS